MALYLGENRVKINLDRNVYYLNLVSTISIIDYVGLLSSDNYILKDSNGIYLLPSDYISPVLDKTLLSLDGYILKDSNGIYLTIKEGE